MNRYPATPAEWERLMEQLEPLREEMQHRRRPRPSVNEIASRTAGIARLVFEEVATCPRCDRPIRRCDKRTLVEIDGERQLVHLSLACAGREPERELSGEELQEAKDRPVRRVGALRARRRQREGGS